MLKVSNFSRHDLNVDQVRAIQTWREMEIGLTLKPFFTSAEHLRSQIDGQTSVVVAPGAMLLELWADHQPLADGTRIIQFGADQSARKRGCFAATSITIFAWVNGRPVKIHQEAIVPTVEQSFRSGEVTPYAG